MISLDKRKNAFLKTGEVLRGIADHSLTLPAGSKLQKPVDKLKSAIAEACLYNGWFTEEMVRHMIASIGESLQYGELDKWIAQYLPGLDSPVEQRNIAVIMAGNIPVVGFHDFLTVLMSGHKLLARMSSDDDKLLPAITEILLTIEPDFEECVVFETGKLRDFDAVIATGSDNTARYFEYYFGKYPHIIRKNRNGIAVLNGEESEEEVSKLADDIFLYFGLGCRNISKLYVPQNYDFNGLLEEAGRRNTVTEHSKYFNNYEYNKAIYLINQTGHFDSSNLLLVESDQIASPLSVLFFEYYNDLQQLNKVLENQKEEIQCIVSNVGAVDKAIPLGKSQQPQLWDYADGIDTMEFLLNLK